MIYPNVNTESWVKEHGLIIKSYTCPICSKQFKTDIPVMTKDSAGLVSPEHSCGKGYYGFVMVPRSERAKRFWSEFRDLSR